MLVGVAGVGAGGGRRLDLRRAGSAGASPMDAAPRGLRLPKKLPKSSRWRMGANPMPPSLPAALSALYRLSTG